MQPWPHSEALAALLGVAAGLLVMVVMYAITHCRRRGRHDD